MGNFLLPSGLVLLGLAALQIRIVRYVTYPPALLCGVWGVALLWVDASGSRYLPIDERTIAIYVIGAFAFTVGGALGWNLLPASFTLEDVESTAPDWLVPALTALVLLMTPLFVAKTLAVVANASPLESLYLIRQRTLDVRIASEMGPARNVVPFAIMCTLLATALPPRTHLGLVSRALMMITTLGITILTGSRSGPLSLILGMGIVASVRAQRVPFRRGLAVAVVALALFGVMGVLVRKGNASPDAGFDENIVAVSRGLQDYALGGIVAFDGVVTHPGSISASWTPLRTVQEMANHLGARYEVPSLHAQFSNIGDGLITNVYTMYFSYYPEVGFAGMLGLVFIVGLATGSVHRQAVNGSVAAVLFHGVLAASALQSIFNEPFYTNANFLLKLTLFTFVIRLVTRRRLPLEPGALAPPQAST